MGRAKIADEGKRQLTNGDGMIEFLIKRRDGEFFDFPQVTGPLHPITISYRQSEDWGDERIEVDGCEVSFSYEAVGVQVSFEGDITQARSMAIVEEIRQYIELVCGQSAETLQIAW